MFVNVYVYLDVCICVCSYLHSSKYIFMYIPSLLFMIVHQYLPVIVCIYVCV